MLQELKSVRPVEPVAINPVHIAGGEIESVRVFLHDPYWARWRVVDIVIGDRVPGCALVGAAADVAEDDWSNRRSGRVLDRVAGDRPPPRGVHPDRAEPTVAEAVAGDSDANGGIGEVIGV